MFLFSLFKFMDSRYNRFMNTSDKTPNNRQQNIDILSAPETSVSKSIEFKRSKKLALRRKLLRQKQVRRQKLFLAGALLLLATVFVILFSNQKPNEYLTINEACEAYRPDVEQAAASYGMSDYVDLILALMMQESSGRGPDVLQSSEGAYNQKYPQVPGGITDVDYSISCGIQELKYAMNKAGVSSPTDLDAIRLALQGYNFGADVYFSYLDQEGITSWSEETAEAFAQKASGNTPRLKDDPLYQTAGPWDYGDQKYPEHVLRYYHP